MCGSNRVHFAVRLLLFACLLTAVACGPNKKLLYGEWTSDWVAELGSAPGEPLVSMSRRNMTIYPDGSLEITNDNITNTGKWTLHGSALTLAPPVAQTQRGANPEQTFAIVKIDESHLTLKATGSGKVEKWTKIKNGS
jgi:hypothetical protein